MITSYWVNRATRGEQKEEVEKPANNPNQYSLSLRHSAFLSIPPAPAASSTMAMAQIYPRMDMNNRYGERSMDAKIVVMGNTFVFLPPTAIFSREIVLTFSLYASHLLLTEVLARPACFTDILRVNSIPRTRLQQRAHFL